VSTIHRSSALSEVLLFFVVFVVVSGGGVVFSLLLLLLFSFVSLFFPFLFFSPLDLFRTIFSREI